ncbi:MAG: SDR family oxidoreductase [Bacteroidota bacterium]|nr:SDR family oxidoreductase [Bacteroidota bacterium]
MSRRSQEEIIIVTGASRGVGYATVQSLVRDHGKRVLAISRNEEKLEQLQQESGGEEHVQILPLDIAAPEAASHIKQVVASRRVLALMHNAGLLHSRPMGQHKRADLELLYAINVFAPLEITQALVEELDGTPAGHIVHIGSMGGFQDSSKFAGLVAYSASKAALAAMAQCLAEEFKDRGIRSNCLALGSVDTEMLRDAFPGYKAGMTAQAMGNFIARFALEGHLLFNGKVLPVATTTP